MFLTIPSMDVLLSTDLDWPCVQVHTPPAPLQLHCVHVLLPAVVAHLSAQHKQQPLPVAILLASVCSKIATTEMVALDWLWATSISFTVDA